MANAGHIDGQRMHRDNWLSVLIGPLKFVVPTLSYLVLYPLMISETSIEVVGIWSLIAATVSFVSVTDIGFSQLLTRDAGQDRSEHLHEVHADYLAARRSYGFMLLVLVLAFLSTSKFILTPLAGVYSLPAMTFSIILILAGAMLQLAGKLDAAILSARHDNYVVQLVTAIAPALTYSSAIIGTLLKRPIEGLAVGTVLTSVATVTVYRLRLSKNHDEWILATRSLKWRESTRRVLSLTRRGWHLYSCSIGMMIRGPIYRLVIVSTIGLQAAAVFDIAMRVTQTVREVIATGFSVLFPSFSILCRSGDQARIIELIQVSLMVLLSLGALSLGLLIGVVAPMLSLWLGDFPAELVPSTRVLAIWQIITLANVPFWYLLQATHNERIAAYSIWAHTSAIILVVPFSNAFTVGIVELLVYWTVTSVFTQGLIYFHVQRRLELLWASVLAPRILALLALVIGYSVFSYWVSTSVGDTWSLAASFIFTSAAYIAISGLIVIDPLRKFIEQGANR